MATKLSILQRDLTAASSAAGRSGHAQKFLVDICAGYGLAHSKLVKDIEALDAAVVDFGSDIDFTPRVSEAIKHLPVVSEQYYTSLVRLGIVAVVPEEDVPGADKKNNVVDDGDALEVLRRKVNGE